MPQPTHGDWPTGGWRESLPDAQHLDPDHLVQAVEQMTTHYPHFDSLLVVRNGQLVLDHYATRAGLDVLHNVKSVTKSVLSILVGIAIQIGDLAGVDEPIGYILPALFTSVDDRRKREITVEHLLTMQSGLEWSEWGSSTAEMTSSPNWVDYVLDRPLAHAPGTHFNYSTGDTQVLSRVLQAATGLTALEYADLYLFGPLGIEGRRWPADPQGTTIGGAELALSARDMAKLGFLYLKHGEWDGAQIVPAAWVRASIQRQATVIPAGARDCQPLDYGYLWWLRDQGGYPSHMAVGFGGQYIYVIPALDLIVVMTGDVTTAPDTFRDNRMLCQFNLVQEFVVPAVRP
jgi:CubicO group peptidase (beta-lactamase class C family)